MRGACRAIAFVALLVEHGDARWVGVVWMVAGISLYVGYRTSQGKHVLKRVTVPESALTRRAAEAEFGSMLVPVLGTPLDDDIMQTAGRLAAEENADEGEGGAVIEALWIFEVPMALPLDTRVPDAELKRARAALKRAKAVGEEYEGVEVATAVVRARKAGQAIVHEAKRRGVEAVVLAAEEPTRVGGGLRLGGKPGLHDTSVGETTRYVVNKAHVPRDPDRAARRGGARSDGPGARPTRRSRSATPSACPIARVLVACSYSWSERGAWEPPLPRQRWAVVIPCRSSTRIRCRTSGWTSSSGARGRRPAAASRSAPRWRSTR